MVSHSQLFTKAADVNQFLTAYNVGLQNFERLQSCFLIFNLLWRSLGGNLE